MSAQAHRALVLIDARPEMLSLEIKALALDGNYRLCTAQAGCYMATGDYIATDGRQGHRTRLYVNAQAAQRALDRGELYTLAEYTELTTVTTTRKR